MICEKIWHFNYWHRLDYLYLGLPFLFKISLFWLQPGREIKIICFGDKVRGTQSLQLALYLYIWFVFCVNLHIQIEFVTLICILLWLHNFSIFSNRKNDFQDQSKSSQKGPSLGGRGRHKILLKSWLISNDPFPNSCCFF